MADSNPSVARSASRMGLATLCSRVLGLLREQVFAYFFGASNAADAFNIAFRIPNLLRDLFAEGAMSAAFVPNFTRALMKSRDAAFRLLASVLSVLLVTLTLLSIVGIIFAPELVKLYAGSFAEIPGKFEMSVGLTRLMFPFFPMVAMAAVTMGALNALGFFFLPAFAPVLFNVASVVCGVVLCPLLAKYTDIHPIYGMGIGVVLGGFLQFYVQWWQIRKQGLNLRETSSAFIKPWDVSGTKSVLFLLIPGTLGLAATQLNILINSVYATGAGPGAVSWLNYAFRLMQFPIGIFGVSLAAATLPSVSRRLAANDAQGAAIEIRQSLRMTFSVNFPAMAGLMAVGLPILQLIFQHGQFSYSDSQQTASALFWYAAGLPGYSVVKVLVPVFYALGSTRIPVIVSFAMVGLNAVLNHIFLNVLGFPFWALAAATSITATLNAIFLAAWLQTKLPGSVDRLVAGSLILHSCVGLAIGLAVSGVLRVLRPLETVLGTGMLFWAIEVSASILAALFVWWGLGRVLKIDEIEKATRFVSKKLRRTR